MFGVTCTCSWLELFVVIWSWVKNDAAPFLGVGGLVGGYDERFESIIETDNKYPLRALKNELSRLNDSDGSGDTIRKKALNKIIKERNSKIDNYVLNYRN